MTISQELLDELLKDCERPEDLLGEAGLMKELKVKLMERMLGAELTAHLGYEAGQDAPPVQSNRRNGSSSKVLKGQDGELPISVPRDRDGSFEPALVKQGQTRIDGMDDKITGLYAAGLSVRDIRAHLEDVYGLQVSPDLISRVTDAVLDEVREWQSRALERMYPIVILDALRIKIRDADSRQVQNKAVYVALGVSRDGTREVLGLWLAGNEGAKFWLSVMNELKNRGVAHHHRIGVPRQHHAAVPAAQIAGAEPGRKHLAVPAPELPVEPRLRQLRRQRRCAMPRLEQAHRQALENHVDWYAQMGTRRSNSMTVGITPRTEGTSLDQCHLSSHRGLDRQPGEPGLSLGDRAAIPHQGPRYQLRQGLQTAIKGHGY